MKPQRFWIGLVDGKPLSEQVVDGSVRADLFTSRRAAKARFEVVAQVEVRAEQPKPAEPVPDAADAMPKTDAKPDAGDEVLRKMLRLERDFPTTEFLALRVLCERALGEVRP